MEPVRYNSIVPLGQTATSAFQTHTAFTFLQPQPFKHTQYIDKFLLQGLYNIPSTSLETTPEDRNNINKYINNDSEDNKEEDSDNYYEYTSTISQTTHNKNKR